MAESQIYQESICFVLCVIYALELVLNVIWTYFVQHNSLSMAFIFHYVVVCLLIIPKIYLVIKRHYVELFCLSLVCLVEFLAFFVIPVVLTNPEKWYIIAFVGVYAFVLILAYTIIIFQTNQNAKIF